MPYIYVYTYIYIYEPFSGNSAGSIYEYVGCMIWALSGLRVRTPIDHPNTYCSGL